MEQENMPVEQEQTETIEQEAGILVAEAPQQKKKPYLLIAAIAAGAVLLVGAVVGMLLHLGQRREPLPATTESTVQETQSVFTPNPYGPTDFQYEGDYLTCLAGESMLGVDVSSFQGNIDWEQVRAAGVTFAMIRVGGRGYGQEGTLYEDSLAQANYAGAKAAGLQVGAYFFSQAVSVEEAEEEAAYLLELIRDWELELPVVFDWEYLNEEARTANVDKRTLTDCTLAFCQKIQQSGCEPMIYFNPNQMANHIYMEELTQYRSWLALYTDRMDFPHRVDLWQYTNAGSVPGIEGPVDINLYFSY